MWWVLNDITEFFVSIIQIMWVPWMSICLDEFWIIVSITQFFDFWAMSYGNWKHILGVFSFQNSVFNNIFVIKPTYPTAMFDKWIFFFFGWNPAAMFDKFFDFFFGWNLAATFEVENWVRVKVPNRGFEKLRYFKWWVMSDEWWKLSNENWVMTNYKPNRPLMIFGLLSSVLL